MLNVKTYKLNLNALVSGSKEKSVRGGGRVSERGKRGPMAPRMSMIREGRANEL